MVTPRSEERTRHSERGVGVGRLALFFVAAVGIVGAAWSSAFSDLTVGDEAKERQEYEAAITYFSKIIQSGHLSPENLANAFYNRGNAFYKLGQKGRAIEDYSQSLRYEPGNADAYYNRGNVHAGFDRHDQAIQDYSKAIELQPDHDLAYYNRANSHFRKGNYQLAIEDYTKAYRLNSDDRVYEDKMRYLGLLE